MNIIFYFNSVWERTTGYSAFNLSGLNLHLSIDFHWAPRQLHHRTVQLHDDVTDSGWCVDCRALHLDVKIFIDAITCRGQDMVTGGRQLEEMSIKGLEVIVSPCRAHAVDVRCISYNNINIKTLFWTNIKSAGKTKINLVHLHSYLNSRPAPLKKKWCLLLWRRERIIWLIQNKLYHIFCISLFWHFIEAQTKDAIDYSIKWPHCRMYYIPSFWKCFPNRHCMTSVCMDCNNYCWFLKLIWKKNVSYDILQKNTKQSNPVSIDI